MQQEKYNKDNLLESVREGSLERVRELVNCFGLTYSREWEHGYVLLREALSKGHTAVAKLLLTSGCEVNSKNNGTVFTPLHYAALLSDIEIIKMILDKGGEVNAITDFGTTPLNCAIQSKNIEVIELLLNYGADVNARSNDSNIPSTFATETEVPETEFLLEHGTSLSCAITRRCHRGYTPLFVAVETGSEVLMEFLITRGAIVDSKGEDDITPLHIAAKNGYLSICEYLLNCGVSVNSLTVTGFTPLHFACEEGHEKTAQLFVDRGADVNISTKNKETPLHIATRNWQKGIVNILLQNGASVDKLNNGKTALHLAVENRCLPVVDLLLQHGAQVDNLNKDGKTALHLAVEKGYLPIVELIINYHPNVNSHSNKSSVKVAVQNYGVNYSKILDALTEYGLKFNDYDAKNPKLLRHAVEKGYIKIVEELLKFYADINTTHNPRYDSFTPLHDIAKNIQEKKSSMISHESHINIQDNAGKSCDANINARDANGRTALHFTVFYEDNICRFLTNQDQEIKAGIAKMLLNKGANVDAQTEEGITALHFATQEEYGKVIQVLLEYKANVNIQTESGTTPLHLSVYKENEEITEILLKNGANVGAKQIDSTTALHNATTNGNKYIITLLIEYGANIESKMEHDISPLHLAAQIRNEEIIKIFLNKGANVNAKQTDGVTALHIATQKGFVSTVKTLLEHGAIVDVKTEQDITPLHIAAQNGNQLIIEVILKFDPDIDSRDEQGSTALHLTSKIGHHKSTAALLANGSDVNIKCRNNKTALEYAKANIRPRSPVYERVSNYSHARTTRVLIYHVVKLKVANLFVTKQNLALSFSNSDDGSYIESLCTKEISNMKRKKITDIISLYDILTKRARSLAKDLNNENVEQVLKSEKYEKRFPIYASIIKINYKKAMKWNEFNKLLEQSNKVFHFFFNNSPELPYDCIKIILDYLSINDLRNLIAACEIIN